MNDIKLSVCYIVKNEAFNLPMSLEKVREADEIIVVDTGSQDETKEIAVKFGAHVYEFPWRDDFSAPRNFAIEQARGEWIIFLDADEAFCHQLNKEKMLQYLAGLSAADAVLLCLQNIESWEDQDISSTSWVPRIFRRREDLRYRGRIHEHIDKVNGMLQVVYGPQEFSLLHTGYSEVLSPAKSRRNLEILHAAMAEGAWEPVYDYYLTDCYYGLQMYEKALVHAQKYVESGTLVHGGNGHIYRMILECMRHLSLPDEQMLPWAERACREYPDLPEFYGERGMVLCGMGRLLEARELLRTALKIYENGCTELRHETYFSREVAAKVAARLGEIDALYGNNESAAEWFLQALEYCTANQHVVGKVEKFLAEYEKGQES